MPRRDLLAAKARLLTLLVVLAVSASAFAHDIWLEPSTNLVRCGDWLQLSLMLGNHGNEHRDFRLASKVAAGQQNLRIYGPGKLDLDLTPDLIDNGYTPQEGFWSARFSPQAPGLYMAVSTFDQVMSYAPVRDVKCAKTFFLVSKSLDQVPSVNPGFDRGLGLPLEIVPQVNPITPFGAGSMLKVRVLYQGKPLAGTKVSFIPKGAELHGDLDPSFEKLTDAQGEAQLTLKEANIYLVVAHHADETARGPGYRSIGYSASLTLVVPGECPCCVGS